VFSFVKQHDEFISRVDQLIIDFRPFLFIDVKLPIDFCLLLNLNLLPHCMC
jgi:hypothetical protein